MISKKEKIKIRRMNEGLKLSYKTEEKVNFIKGRFVKGQRAWNKGKKRWWKSPSQFKKGHKLSQDTKDKISKKMRIIQMGENNSDWKGGRSLDKNYIREYKRNFYQKKYAKHTNGWTLERRRKYSEMMKGNNSPLWMGGKTKKSILIRSSSKYKMWRKQVLQRDNWTCQVCDKRGGDLEIHHIKSFAFYPELRFELSNGIILCKECHKKTDTYLNPHNTRKKPQEVIIRHT